MAEQEYILKQIGKMIGGAMTRNRDAKSAAMFNYFAKHFIGYRNGKMSPQAFVNGCKKAWDEAELQGERGNEQTRRDKGRDIRYHNGLAEV